MKKLFTILLLGIWVNVSAHEVLDSEATDYESESEQCKTLTISSCTYHEYVSAPTTYVFNPIQKSGSFQVIPNWYLINHKLNFIPVQRNR